MITLIEPTDPCAMCTHPRFMHMESEYWNDSGDWYWVYEECTEQGCDCQMFAQQDTFISKFPITTESAPGDDSDG